MSKKSLILLLLLALLPLSAVAWLGWRVARAETARVQTQFQLLVEERLAENNRQIQQFFARLQRGLSSQIDGCGDTSTAIRQLVRDSPQVRQIVVFNRRGDLVHPQLDAPISDSEREFLSEIAEMIRDKDLVRLAFQNHSDPQEPLGTASPSTGGVVVVVGESVEAPGAPDARDPNRRNDPSEPSTLAVRRALSDEAAATQSDEFAATPSGESAATRLGKSAVLQADVQSRSLATPDAPTEPANQLQAVPGSAGGMADGWFTWYWGRGINLMYWRRWSDDRLTVIALPRARWMADLLALLPETKRPTTDTFSNPAMHCIRMVDASDQVIYQWGHLQPLDSLQPIVETSVVPPLSSWRLKYFVEPSTVQSEVSRVPLFAGLAGMACGLLGLVIVLYREYSREMREAMQRVNFVNQVSHELKTPLTNIRLYADLLERDLDRLPVAQPENLEKPRSRLNVITSESQRLSRLITHVLTFARAERNQLTACLQEVDLDQLVRDVVERFRPALEADAMHLELSADVREPIQLDPDMVEQILENLISNAQRYAADGRYLQVRTFIEHDCAIVEVADRGPGIPAKLARRLFQPFARGARALSDRTGTGIGLSIARRLARLQGGDLVWLPTSTGATFRLILSKVQHHESVIGRG